jgi:membrane associated rhomboid family serine protease
MLILPLHRPLTRANFPIATALLMLANVFVFLFLQGGDNAAMGRARQHYVDAQLGRYELPAYERHLQQAGRKRDLDEFHAVPEPQRAAWVASATLTDVSFVDRLQRGELFESTSDYALWKPLRARYDELNGDVFTLRHVLRSSEIDPWRMLSSAFLHAGLMHLVGNMVFLGALGLLVEGAIGAWRFGALYLLGALGSSAASLAWRWGEAGGGLGASGAIAALMGAFCVIWGRHPVRFFYWFGVVFDYVRKPAIWLLPLWLGWEVYNLLANEGLGIGFDAHAGGIVTGALLGAGLVSLRQVRNDYVHGEDVVADQDDRWQRAQRHLGRMQLAEADELLAALQREQPQRFDIALARYRVARNGGQRMLRRDRGLELLAIGAPDVEAAQAQVEVLEDLLAAQSLVPAALQPSLAARWLALQLSDAVERLLTTHAVGPAESRARLWFELGLQRRSRAQDTEFRRAMQVVVTQHAELPQAAKARFLLENS